MQGWLLAAVASAGIGLLQYAGSANGLWPWVVPTPPGEAFGNLRQRNQFATLTNMGLAALLWSVAKNETTSRAGKMASMLFAILLGIANAASSSRTGMVQLVLIAGLFWFWGVWKQAVPRHLLLQAMLAFAVASILLPLLIGSTATEHGIWARLREGEEVCNSRYPLWTNVLHLISQRPWTGWGWGELEYAHFITLYPGVRFCEILDNAHNLPLHLAVELGLPMATLLCALAVSTVWRARPWAEKDPARQLAWTILSLILLHSMLEYPLWYGPFQLAILQCLWLFKRKPSDPTVTLVHATPHLEIALAAGLLALAGYIEWDYHRVSQIYLPPENRAVEYREHTLEKIRGSWLFREQVRFAEYTITPLNHDNAPQLYALGQELLHYSPEPRVVEKLIESAILMGREDDARFYLARFRAAYPKEHAQWMAKRARSLPPRD